MPPDAIRIVLVRVRNPLNIGAAARAMANFGLDDLALVEPYSAAWETVRSARAGLTVLQQARTFATLAEAVAGCETVVGTTAGTGRVPELPLEEWQAVVASLPAGRTAVVFGSEKTGLGVEEISFCHRLARIPTRPQAPSMNLGQAVAVCAYELTRASKPVTAAPRAGVDAAQRERVVEAWLPLLEQLGTVHPGHQTGQRRILREMLTRWRITPAEARRLLGVARQLGHTLAGRRES
ncbi:MAG TPA: TrmH family RNA methyltransferase [Terriglobales bacterium]|nr:TrmH family RNA methyltransferase [Terriglobales bacterium]